MSDSIDLKELTRLDEVKEQTGGCSERERPLSSIGDLVETMKGLRDLIRILERRNLDLLAELDEWRHALAEFWGVDPDTLTPEMCRTYAKQHGS